MLRQRLIFGSLLIAGLLGVLWLDGQVAPPANWPAGVVLLVVFLGLIALGSRELAGVFAAKGVTVHAWLAAVGGMGACGLVYFEPWLASRGGALGASGAGPGQLLLGTWLGIVMLAGLVMHSVPLRRTEGAASAGAATLFCAAYMGLLAGFYIAMRRDHSAWVVAGVILVIKSCDSGAYFTGRAVGKHKLIPWLSPGKTWEGLIGGLATSAVAAVGLAAWADARGVLTLPLWYAALGGAVVGGLGHVGDLVASLLKRDAGLKDSGKLIPGMGGVLDVVDSPLLAAPLAYWWLVMAP